MYVVSGIRYLGSERRRKAGPARQHAAGESTACSRCSIFSSEVKEKTGKKVSCRRSRAKRDWNEQEGVLITKRARVIKEDDEEREGNLEVSPWSGQGKKTGQRRA